MTVRTHVAACFAISLIVTGAAAQEPAKDKVVPAVGVAVLEPLLPQADGWTRGAVRSNKISSDDCGYTYVDAVYAKGESRVRLTVADTGFDSGALSALVPSVISLPEGYSGKILPATTVDRLVFQGFPAAARVDGEKAEADFEVLAGRRFVAKGEGTHVTGIDPVRDLVGKIDLKKLAGLQ